MQHRNIHVLSRGVILDQDQILLAKDIRAMPPFYYIPGGHIEPGESAIQALKRELWEEIGYSFEIGKFLGCLEYSFIPDQSIPICHTHEYNFLFLATSKEINPKSIVPSKESHLELEWVSLQELGKMNLLPPPFKSFIPKWIKDSSVTLFQSHMV